MRSFPELVFDIVAQVPHGRVITYGAIARLLGEPRKARQVGWAMASGPRDGKEIPAHRVINARGELSGGDAFGGYEVQRERLEAEGVIFMADGRVDLDIYLWLPDVKPSGQFDGQSAGARDQSTRSRRVRRSARSAG